MAYAIAAFALWVGFLLSWHAAMFWTARATAKAPLGRRLLYLLGFLIGFCLLFSLPPTTFGGKMLPGFDALLPESWRGPLWRQPVAIGWLMVAIELAACAFAWWARLHLGRLWSGMLTLREGHRVVDTGPYRLVRHPIYTGFILASWAFALAFAGGPMLAGALALTLVMAIKAGEEERFLRRELGSADYDAYAARTPMLIPGGWR